MKFRAYPTVDQQSALLDHCGHARYVWNLAVEQLGFADSRLDRWCPNFAEQCRQLTAARAENDWLRSGVASLQQQALRDFDQAMKNWRNGTHGRPNWRKRNKHEGFRVVGYIQIEKLSRRWSRVQVPKIGWIKFRSTRHLEEVRSFRVTRDSAGRWFVAFPVIPDPLPGPGDDSKVGIDRGIKVTLALSDGTVYQAPAPRSVRVAAKSLSRCKRGSNRRAQARHRLAKVYAHNKDRRKDWIEKTSTEIARRYNLICIEDLKVKQMVRSARGTRENPGRNVQAKAALNRAIMTAGWSMFATRLEFKASGRVEKVNPAYTSQRCSACQHVARESRKSQALFCCVACGHTSNADLNAAKNIAAGYAARGDGVVLPSKKRILRQRSLAA